MKEVALARIAHGRSGDKGDTVNVGVIARRSEWYPLLARLLTVERVKTHFGDAVGEVQPLEALPGANSQGRVVRVIDRVSAAVTRRAAIRHARAHDGARGVLQDRPGEGLRGSGFGQNRRQRDPGF